MTNPITRSEHANIHKVDLDDRRVAGGHDEQIKCLARGGREDGGGVRYEISSRREG